MSDDVLVARASAKVNLFLHVGPVRADGRHDLSSMVVFTGPEVADTLSLSACSVDRLTVDGPFAEDVGPENGNLILKAVARLRGQVRIPPDEDTRLAFHLHKAIPVAAGLGGGSADAAAALRLMVREAFDLPDRVMSDIAPQLGGDVLACVESRPALMSGDGDIVTPILQPATLDLLSRRGQGGLPAVLVNPGIACPTGPVFRRFDEMGGAGALREKAVPDVDYLEDFCRWLVIATRNDLERPAIDLVPEIGFLLERLRELPGAQIARMTGSGATCFAIFRHMDEALAAQAQLSREAPHWWARATRLGEGAE